MTPQEFDALCGRHDWTYAYADDNRSFYAGERTHAALQNAMRNQPEFRAIYNLYGEYIFSGKSFNKPEMTREEFMSQQAALLEYLSRGTTE